MRSVGSLAGLVATAVGCGLGELAALGLVVALLGVLDLLGLDDVDAHLGEHGQDVLDLLGGDLLGGQDRVQLVIGDEAALLGDLDHLLDGGIGQVEQRTVRGLGRGRGFRFFVFLDLGRHSTFSDTAGPAPGGACPAARAASDVCPPRPPWPIAGAPCTPMRAGRCGLPYRRSTVPGRPHCPQRPFYHKTLA